MAKTQHSQAHEVQSPTRDADALTVTVRVKGYAYVGTYANVKGELRLTELRLLAVHGTSLTVEQVRSAPLTELHAAAAAVAQGRTTDDIGGTAHWLDGLPSAYRTREDYQRLLRAHASLVATGDRRPLFTIAEATGAPHNTVAARLKTARKRLAERE